MLGVIGGTGLNDFSEIEGVEESLITTPYGVPSSSIITGELNGRAVAFLARHGRPHCIPPHCVNYRANIWALKEIGVTEIIAVNAVGGISINQEPGVISVADQLIDYTYGREHTYFDNRDLSLEHIDFTYPYSEPLRINLIKAADDLRLKVESSATLGVMQGPRLETAAEIRKLAGDGCDLVGMTGMPEAALARELSLDYACLAVVVNKAAGISSEEITMESIEAVMKEAIIRVKALISTYCAL